MKMLKRVAVLLLIMSVVMMPVGILNVCAASEYTDTTNNITYTLDSDTKTAAVKAGTSMTSGGGGASATGDVVIPETLSVDGVEYTVTSIGKFAFAKSQITGVTIPGTINYASITASESQFVACGNLTSVTLKNGINRLTKNMFSTCTKLEELVVPSSVTEVTSSFVTKCTLMKKIVFEGTTNFNPNKFNTATNMGSKVDGGTVFEVKSSAMAEIIKSAIENGGTTASFPKLYSGENIFMSKDIVVNNICYSISTNFAEAPVTSAIVTGNTISSENPVDVVIPAFVTDPEDTAVVCKVTEIKGSSVSSSASAGDGAFYKANVGKVTLPEGLEKIGKEAFYGSTVTSVNIPSTVEFSLTDDTGIFKACSKLSVVDIADGVNLIPRFMFYSDNALSEITIPQSVEYVAYDAFMRCRVLAKVTLKGNSFKIVDKSLNEAKFDFTKSNAFGTSTTIGGDGNTTSVTKFYVFSDSAKTEVIRAGVADTNVIAADVIVNLNDLNVPMLKFTKESDFENGICVIFAAIGSSGRMSVYASSYAASDFTLGEEKTLSEFAGKATAGDTVRVMVCKNSDSIIPICERNDFTAK